MNFIEKIDIGHIILISTTILSFLFAIWQLILKRRFERNDKLIDRRYETYSAYMKKADELMNNVRTDPNMIFGISTEFMKIALTGDEEQINKALIQFNEKLLDFVKKATEPLLIIKQELNSLLIICSDELSSSIEELNLLTTDFNNEMQKSLSLISSNDSNNMIRQFKTLGHNERWLRFESLNKEIIRQMRKELGNK
ncbi:MAG: hypothetical protein ISS80_02155 [Candidatus Cloacimonetes bacterium]|nr:hypothetical protein [Candidatus Cloacimonadota bacterium]